ncbi:Nucleolar protein 6 [Mactra antiquata]
MSNKSNAVFVQRKHVLDVNMKRKAIEVIPTSDDSPDANEGSDVESKDNESSSLSDEDEMEMEESEGTESRFSQKGSKRDPSSGEPVSKMAKMTKSELYKPPTNEEMNHLKETENLFHSSLFRLQITELLSEVRLKDKRKQDIETAVCTVRNAIMKIKKGDKYELQDTTWLDGSGIKVPFRLQPTKIKGSFQFMPPTDVKITGSFLSETCMKPHVTTDIVVVMPKECIDPKDFMNQRYLRKRALYLCFIANSLSKSEKFTNIKFSCLHGNSLKPILLASVTVPDRKNVSIAIHIVPEEGVFKMTKFHIRKNNIRTHWYTGLEDTKTDQDQGPPTPFYNSSILEDMISLSTIKQMEQIASGSQGLKDGIILLKIWLKQRGLDQGYGGFTCYLMTMYVIYLLSIHKLNPLMSSYQVFRNTLLKLADSNMNDCGVSLCTVTNDENMPTIEDFHNMFDVVFVDTTGYFNYGYTIEKTVYQRMKYEAKFAITILDDPSIDSFDKLFMKKVKFTSKFDHIFHIDCNKDVDGVVKKLDVSDKLMDYGGQTNHSCVTILVSKLETALSQRVDTLQVLCQDIETWNITESPHTKKSSKLTFGLMLNPDYAFNILDRGPSADSLEAAEFRNFWGSKSEIRRFQDGGICEAVLWLDKASYALRQGVCEKIVKYTLQRHAGIQSSNIHYFGMQTDNVLKLPPAIRFTKDEVENTGEERNNVIIQVYDELCKSLRKLQDLPLTINSVQGVAECFRCTEVFPQMPCSFRHQEKSQTCNKVKQYIPDSETKCPFYTQTLKVVCLLESSGKWPKEIEAMKRLKAAFHIQLGNALKEQFNLPVRVTLGYVDVLKDNYVFRVVLAYVGEIGLLKTFHSEDGKVLKRDTDEALKLEREIIGLPRLTSTLHGLAQQHPSFSTTTRLAKRWLSSNMLDDFIEPVVIDLLVASLYLSSAPYQPPRSGLCGFQRFLELLSSFDWKITPFLINLNNEFTADDLVEIPTKFSNERQSFPLMFISTPLDKYSSHWTKHKPQANILHRLVLLAIQSLNDIQQNIMNQSTLDLKPIFKPDLSMFDVLIHLKPNQLPRRYEGLEFVPPKHKQLYGLPVDDTTFPVTNFDPPQLFLQELKKHFKELALFFYDKYGGTVIGLLWKPVVKEEKEFKVSNIKCSELLTKSTGQVKLVKNISSIIEDMKILGKGLINKIEINNA